MSRLISAVLLAVFVHIIVVYVNGSELRIASQFQYLSEKINTANEDFTDPNGDQWKIVGGSDSGSVPWQVSILMDDTQFCAGSLIALDKVLTSAQCVKGYSTFQLHFGSEFVFGSGDPNPAEVQHRGAKMSYVHPQFSLQTLQFDVAVIVLDSPVIETISVYPVNLPSPDDSDSDGYVNMEATVSGWGTTEDGVGTANFSEVLQAVDVTVISNEECTNTLFGSLIVDTHICTSGIGGVGLCVGDAGGALTITDPVTSDVIQIGIASFVSVEGCKADQPAGFTRVTSFLEWIRNPYNADSAASVPVGVHSTIVAISVAVMWLI